MADRPAAGGGVTPDPGAIRSAMAKTRRSLGDGLAALRDRLLGTDPTSPAPLTQGEPTVAKAPAKPAKKAASAKPAAKAKTVAKKPAVKTAAKTTAKKAAAAKPTAAKATAKARTTAKVKTAAKKPALKAAGRTTAKPAAKGVKKTAARKPVRAKPKTVVAQAAEVAKDVLVDVGTAALAGAVHGAATAAAEHLDSAAETTERAAAAVAPTSTSGDEPPAGA